MATVVHFNLCLVVYIMFVITNKPMSQVLSVSCFCALVYIWRLITSVSGEGLPRNWMILLGHRRLQYIGEEPRGVAGG
jgi:hypothetical protein